MKVVESIFLTLWTTLWVLISVTVVAFIFQERFLLIIAQVPLFTWHVMNFYSTLPQRRKTFYSISQAKIKYPHAISLRDLRLFNIQTFMVKSLLCFCKILYKRSNCATHPKQTHSANFLVYSETLAFKMLSLSFLHSTVCPLSCLCASQRCFFHPPAPSAILTKLSHNCPTCHVCWMCEQSSEGARRKRTS